jgi:type VI protein secretion system component VasK
MGYMSYFVGSYAMAAGHPFLGSLAAWVPWSVLRVLAYILFGCLFARPLLVRRVWPFEREETRLMALAASGLVADVLIKAFLAPGYGLFLRQMAHGVLR